MTHRSFRAPTLCSPRVYPSVTQRHCGDHLRTKMPSPLSITSVFNQSPQCLGTCCSPLSVAGPTSAPACTRVTVPSPTCLEQGSGATVERARGIGLPPSCMGACAPHSARGDGSDREEKPAAFLAQGHSMEHRPPHGRGHLDHADALYLAALLLHGNALDLLKARAGSVSRLVSLGTRQSTRYASGAQGKRQFRSNNRGRMKESKARCLRSWTAGNRWSFTRSSSYLRQLAHGSLTSAFHFFLHASTMSKPFR